MKITVIVTTYNHPDHLDRVLHGYGVQTDTNFDVVVADDGSGPTTASVVKKHQEKWDFPVKHVWQEDDGFRKTAILNKAIEATDADYLIFTDGDFVPRKDLVASHRIFAEEGYYICGSYNRLPQKTTDRVTSDDVVHQRLFNLLWLVKNGYVPYKGFLRLILPSRVGMVLDRWGKVERGRFTGGNASVFRKDAIAVGGFNEKMTYGYEDREFGERLCNYGLRAKRLKHGTLVLHLEHERPYFDPRSHEQNRVIMEDVRQSGRATL